MRYPYKDREGYIWLDPSGWITEERKPCFWCNRLTNRLDPDYGGHFCNSTTCNQEIAAELIRVGEVEHKTLQAYDIAKICHEANRALQSILFQQQSLVWEECTVELQDLVIRGVKEVINNPVIGPADLHNKWVENKEIDGWSFGETKSESLKTHPNMVHWSELPREEQYKDRLFINIVKSFI